MRCRPIGVALATLLAAKSTALAHHSFSMFDQLREIELEGVVREFKYVSPHTVIILEVRQNGAPVTWTLEGFSPSEIAREGWSKTSLRPGDKIKVRISPLHGAGPGGLWVTKQIQFRDGTPIVPTYPVNEN